MTTAKTIIYSELSKDFRVTEDGKLFRLSYRGTGEEKEVEIKANHSEGYCNVCWNGKTYKSHRLMWCLYNECDVDVKLKVDHKDGIKVNNSKENLILDTQRDNTQNLEVHRDGKLVGASFDEARGKWKASIVINKKDIHLGYFDTELEAHHCYVKACELVEQYVDNKQFRDLLREREAK